MYIAIRLFIGDWESDIDNHRYDITHEFRNPEGTIVKQDPGFFTSLLLPRAGITPNIFILINYCFLNRWFSFN